MEIKKINNSLSVSAQISPEDVSGIAKLGFRSIICNRPDGEGLDQPTFAEIEKSAREAGLATQYIPVIPGQILDSDANAFSNALNLLPSPVLAYCRTGARSAALWSLTTSAK